MTMSLFSGVRATPAPPCSCTPVPWPVRGQRCKLSVPQQARGGHLPSQQLARVRWHPTAASASSASGGAAAGQPPARPPFRDWPETARVAARTGAYITALGLAVLLAPGATFGLLFDASRVPSGWVRVGGVLAALYGFYYWGAALDDAEGRHPRRFYAATVVGRLALSAAFVGLVAARQCEPGLLLLAAANAASGALLWQANRRRAAAAADDS